MRLTSVMFELYLPGVSSLKEKRRTITSLKTRIRNRMNVSVAEVGYQETWQRSILAVAWIASDGEGIDRTISALDKLMAGYDELQVLKAERSDFL